MENLSFTLEQIADWVKSESKVSIPSIQRGLVWKPSQVELLWDSILRGFPIGSFMLSDVCDENISEYYLMDGQQRFNAICLGYNTIESPSSVLWLDVQPPISKSSTRKYWIKSTTMSQPWGFKNNDDCDRLNTSEKRDALESFNLSGNIFNTSFSLNQTWPVESNLPIPLYCFLYADLNNPIAFCNSIIKQFKNSDFSNKESVLSKLQEKEYDYIQKELYPAFVKIRNYRINCNLLPKEVIENETSSDDSGQTTLETLFTRLNVGGTKISPEDLNYSAIKAYWPSIKEENDRLAQKYMSPSKLVMLAFRLALTDESKDSGFRNELNIKQIRALSKDNKRRNKIIHLYNDGILDNILSTIDKWLNCTEDIDGTPKVLRTSISRNSPDVYLLLMYFASKKECGDMYISDSEIRALTFLLHWFAKDKHACVQNIFMYCKKGINGENIGKAISQCMHDCQLLHIYSDSEVSNLVKIETNEKWNVYDNVYGPAKEFFGRIFNGWESNSREMLLYAERRYLNSHFSKYDPAILDMWEEYNRPWDFDHIIPQNRISGKKGLYREYDKQWLWCIGNFAAISFEANRSKSDGNNYEEYINNASDLLFDNRIIGISETDNGLYWFTYNKEYAKEFAEITFSRFLKIYSCVYRLISPIVEHINNSDMNENRKRVFNRIQELLPETSVCFAVPYDKDYLLGRKQDWSWEWLGIGIKRDDFFVCYEWTGNGEGELGIRKAPGTIVKKENMALLSSPDSDPVNEWWYTFEESVDESKTQDAEYIVKRLKEIEKRIN